MKRWIAIIFLLGLGFLLSYWGMTVGWGVEIKDVPVAIVAYLLSFATGWCIGLSMHIRD